MPSVLQGEAEDEDGDGHDGRGEPDDDEPRFGLDVAGVAAQVEIADKVVQPVAEHGAQDGAHDGGEVEHSCEGGVSGTYLGGGDRFGEICELRERRTEVVGREIVDGRQPDGDGSVHADDPCKVQKVVYGAQQHR